MHLIYSSYPAYVFAKSSDKNDLDFRRLFRAELTLTEKTIEFNLSSKSSSLPDFLPTNTYCMFLVSKKAKEIFTRSELTGIKLQPVVLSNKAVRTEDYFLLQVSGRANSLDLSNAVRFKKRISKNGPKSNYFKNISIKDKYATGDLYLPEGSMMLLASNKFIDIYDECELTGLRFEELESREFSEMTFISMKNAQVNL